LTYFVQFLLCGFSKNYPAASNYLQYTIKGRLQWPKSICFDDNRILSRASHN